jgi:hypothetical protein
MWHIAIFGYDLEALDCLCVADDIIEENGTVFLDPGKPLLLHHRESKAELITMAARSLHPLLHWDSL